MYQAFSHQLSAISKNITRSSVFLGLLLLLATCYLLPAPSASAQEVSSKTKKDVVKNFKANLDTYSPFGSSSDCSLKAKGDANCDGSVNQFDLSIWEVEFNTANNPRRSDFNGDGVVNLLDFGVWRGTYYPSKLSQAKGSEFLKSVSSQASLIDLLLQGGRVINLISKKAPISQLGHWNFGYFLDQLEIRSIRN